MVRQSLLPNSYNIAATILDHLTNVTKGQRRLCSLANPHSHNICTWVVLHVCESLHYIDLHGRRNEIIESSSVTFLCLSSIARSSPHYPDPLNRSQRDHGPLQPTTARRASQRYLAQAPARWRPLAPVRWQSQPVRRLFYKQMASPLGTSNMQHDLRHSHSSRECRSFPAVPTTRA